MLRSSFVKNFLVLFSGNAIAQVIPFLFAPIIARIFTPEQFAVHGNFTSLVSIIAIIAGGRYELATVIPKIDRRAAALIVLATKITVLVTILSLVLYFFDSQISLFYNDDQISYFLPYVSIAITLVSFNNIVSQWLVRNKLYKAISFSKITQSISLNGATILLGILGYNVGGLIFGWCFGFLTGIVIMLFPFKKTFVFSTFSTKELISVAKQYKDFPMINSLHAFTDIFFSQFLLFAIITREFGMVYLGLFFVMNKYIKAPIRLIGSAVGQVYYKEANENYNANKKVLPIMLQSLKIVSFFALPIMLIVFFFGPTIFSLYLGDEWVRAGEYAQIMALPILFNFLVSPISATPLIFNRQKTAFIISVVGYVASLLAIYIAVKLSWSFKEMLILFSVTMTIYYLYLLFWYIQLSISKK